MTMANVEEFDILKGENLSKNNYKVNMTCSREQQKPCMNCGLYLAYNDDREPLYNNST